MESNSKNAKNNLEYIKSHYILDIIFSFITKKSILNIIIYNKKIQNKLDININNYKSLSKTYIEFISKNIVKQYNQKSNKLIYEGEYKNKKKNGKGKEYYENGKVKFEGEYLNGKRLKGTGYYNEGSVNLVIEKNGKAKEFYKKGEKLFIGKYSNGERNGSGKEYFKNGKLYFNGDYLNGKNETE